MCWRPWKVINAVLTVGVLLMLGSMSASADEAGQARYASLKRLATYLAATDYRRALEECQRELEADPSVEGYVHMTYVYHAIEAYLTFLERSEQWGAVEQLYLNLAHRDAQDLIDPPGGLARMAKETIQTSVQQQADLTAAMAARLDRVATERLWGQQRAWRAEHSEDWWTTVPEAWSNRSGRNPEPRGHQ
ncbi:MAG: hypothetical protein ABW047_12610 [Nitrospiraceae bacterium]